MIFADLSWLMAERILVPAARDLKNCWEECSVSVCLQCQLQTTDMV